MTRRFSRQNLPLDLVALRSATGAGSSVPAGELYYHLAPDQFDRLLAATWRVGRVIVQTFLATNVAPLVLRPQESRYYLFIQNQSALASMVVNFGTPAGAFGIVPTNGIIIPPNFMSRCWCRRMKFQ